MASLSHLSDSELRKKLKEYGISSPITSSTRNILLKKLNHMISTDKKSKNEVSHPKAMNISKQSKINSSVSAKPGTLNTFSSDEEEEEEFPSPARLRRSSRNNSSQNRSLQFQKENSYNSPQQITKNSQIKNIQENKSHPLKFGKNRPSISTRSTNGYPYDTCSDSDTADDDVDTKRYLKNGDTSDFPNTSTSFEQIFRPNPNFSMKRTDKIPFQNRSFNYSFSNNKNSFEGSSFDIKSPDDVVSHEPYSYSLANGQTPLDQSSKASEQSFDGSNWLHSVPLLLVILFALFFGFLGICYINIHSPFFLSLHYPLRWISSLGSPGDVEQIGNAEVTKPVLPKKETIIRSFDLGNLHMELCEDALKIKCLSESELKSSKDFIGLLQSTIVPALIKHSGNYQCGHSLYPYVSMEELRNLVRKKLPDKEEIDIQNGITGLAKLVNLNPGLEIEAFWADDNNKDNLPELLGLATTVKPTEIMCHVTSAFYSIVYFIAALALGGITAWLAVQSFRYYKRQGQQQEEESFELVEKILEMLEASCGINGKEFIAVNHVRDLLISPRDRKLKAAIWNRAVQFIDEHDSRVYREIRNVAGDDCEVWRWVSGAPRSPISCPPKSALPENLTSQERSWQGQAFESLEITQNLPQVSPTSCLKIRNMFDSELEFEDEWPRHIQDSILEKCGAIPIVHIAIDRSSKEGCVYMKCANTNAAGKAFRTLHGSWFDGNLVTVKYLRDERYHERFPTARLATTPLSPSNIDDLSLSTILPPKSSTTTNQRRRSYSRTNFGKS